MKQIVEKCVIIRIIVTEATKCQILRLQCTKFDFGWGSARTLLASYPAYRAPPDALAAFKGLTSKGRERRGRGSPPPPFQIPGSARDPDTQTNRQTDSILISLYE